MTDWAVKVEGLSKIYPLYNRSIDRLLELASFGVSKRHEEFVALKGVDFSIEKGSTVGVIGRNGAGKSTLLKIISGNLAASSGHVSVRGRVSSILELGLGFQPALTGRQNVRINGLLLGLRPKEIEACIPQVIDFSELGDAIDRPIGTYSTGMSARLAFSILTAVNSDVIILDEALATGDVGFVEKGRTLIRSFSRSGSTVLLVSHNMQEVQSVCDRVIWIDKGIVQEDGDADDVVRHYIETMPAVAARELQAADSAPTRIVIQLRAVDASGEGATYPIHELGWLDASSGQGLGAALPYREFHMIESIAGVRAHGLDTDTARRGWGAPRHEDGKPVRDVTPGKAGAFFGLRTPRLSDGGAISLKIAFRDTQKAPLQIDLLGGGAQHSLGTIFGQGDGEWREVSLPMPEACRFETLAKREEGSP